MKSHICLMGAMALLSACSAPKQDGTKNGGQAARSLVLFYSQTGATAQVAQLIQQKTGAVLDSIVAVMPYDGDFAQTIERCQTEMASGTLPDIKPLGVNLADFDTLYVGFPVWFGTAAPPMRRFLESTDFSGKVIYPFCTFGSGGRVASTDYIKNLVQGKAGVKVNESYGVRNARVTAASTELDDYLVSCGIIPGTVSELPAYSEEHAVTDEEKAIFQAVCGSYQMPLGTPVTASSRRLADRNQYCFVTENKGRDGQTESVRILVQQLDAEGSAPEFTEVLR